METNRRDDGEEVEVTWQVWSLTHISFDSSNGNLCRILNYYRCSRPQSLPDSLHSRTRFWKSWKECVGERTWWFGRGPQQVTPFHPTWILLIPSGAISSTPPFTLQHTFSGRSPAPPMQLPPTSTAQHLGHPLKETADGKHLSNILKLSGNSYHK